jgi:hypothetical protein
MFGREDTRRHTAATNKSPAPIAYDPDREDWYVTAACERCGGYRIGLEISDADHEDAARTRADAFLARVHARGGCLGCEARQWREGAAPTGAQPHVWWDTDTGQWMAWRELEGAETGVSFPLGIDTFWAAQEVRAGARALWSSDRLPLRVARGPEAVDGDAPTIFYDPESGRWRLHVACFECRGFELRLTSFGRGAVESACDEALACLALVAREGCPNCRTRREREVPREDDAEPCIWFDVEMSDWVVWQAFDDGDGGVTLPLGIGRFDARRTMVYKAAATLLFDPQLFLDDGV